MNKSSIVVKGRLIELPNSTYVCDFCDKIIVTKYLERVLVNNKEYAIHKCVCKDCVSEALDWSKDE